jgi:hypothetical protein
MNRHRNDLALVMDSADFRRDSHVRARQPGLAKDLENVIVRPTIVLHERRYERRVEAAASALALQAAKLHALLAEPLTRPLGSMQTPRLFTGDDGVTLIQSKKVGVSYEPASMLNTLLTAEPRDVERSRAELRDPRHIGEPVRYDVDRARIAGTEPDTYHGLREMREHAHARLASMEAAAASGRSSPQAELDDARRRNASRVRELGNTAQQHKLDEVRARNARRARELANTQGLDGLHHAQARTSAARPERVARGRSDAHARTATVQARIAPRLRSEGLTDARNALRSAYAASKLRLPNAPPRSSAKNAGVVDGWERLPDPRKTKRAHLRHTRPRAVWPWAAGLALSSMLFTFALTLTVVPESALVPPPQAVAAAAARPSPLSQQQISEPPSPSAPTFQLPRTTTATKTPKPPTRPIARVDCREHATRSH